MSKFAIGDPVRVTIRSSQAFDEVGQVVCIDDKHPQLPFQVRLPRREWWFGPDELTPADPDVHTVLDEMDAESAPRKDMTEMEIDGEYVRGGAADLVNHPAHYGGDTTYEVIKVAEAWGLDKDAYLFNVLKYVARAGKKGDVLEDLEKGDFYLNRRIATIKAAQ